MIRTKLGLLGLCAVVVGMMAMSAVAAQDATLNLLILNAEKTTATELKAALTGKRASAHASLHGEVAGLKIAVTCTAFTLEGVNLELNGKLTEGGKVTFTGCKVYKAAPLTEEYKCTVKSPLAATGTVASGEGKGELVLHTFAKHEIAKEVFEELKKLLTKIEPKAGPTGNFATLRFEGAECPLPEVNQVHGTLYAEDSKATMHELEHTIKEGPLTALYVGGHSAKQLEVTKILGEAKIALAGAHVGLHWAALDT